MDKLDNAIERYSTRELVTELAHREGVDRVDVEPYQDLNISLNGPAIVLTVTD